MYYLLLCFIPTSLTGLQSQVKIRIKSWKEDDTVSEAMRRRRQREDLEKLPNLTCFWSFIFYFLETREGKKCGKLTTPMSSCSVVSEGAAPVRGKQLSICSKSSILGDIFLIHMCISSSSREILIPYDRLFLQGFDADSRIHEVNHKPIYQGGKNSNNYKFVPQESLPHCWAQTPKTHEKRSVWSSGVHRSTLFFSGKNLKKTRTLFSQAEAAFSCRLKSFRGGIPLARGASSALGHWLSARAGKKKRKKIKKKKKNESSSCARGHVARKLAWNLVEFPEGNPK